MIFYRKRIRIFPQRKLIAVPGGGYGLSQDRTLLWPARAASSLCMLVVAENRPSLHLFLLPPVLRLTHKRHTHTCTYPHLQHTCWQGSLEVSVVSGFWGWCKMSLEGEERLGGKREKWVMEERHRCVNIVKSAVRQFIVHHVYTELFIAFLEQLPL